MTGDVPVITNPKDVAKLMSPNASSILDQAVDNPELTPQMAETLRLMKEAEAAKAQKLEHLKEATSGKLIDQSKQKPIELTYRFTGTCSCGNEPMTILIDTPAGLYANAVCISENKQLKSVKVERLNDPHTDYWGTDSVPSLDKLLKTQQYALQAAPVPVPGIIKKKK